ncbi:zeta toxin family protein [Fructilactobacillus vespulae]|uniref:zeta toxin family protein n=1 Tax=Fructilactobacillus vespulae TaxID=1249630 RepID=UPI0039B4745E
MNNLLVIVRGNSASGKTTLTNKIQKEIGYEKCLLLNQDIIRRKILHADDNKNNPSVKMIENLINYGLENYSVTVVEGILRRDVYGNMLTNLIEKNNANTLIYYLDIPFEKTLNYDQMKEVSFGSQRLKLWWREKDYLTNDDIILNGLENTSFFNIILRDINERI